MLVQVDVRHTWSCPMSSKLSSLPGPMHWCQARGSTGCAVPSCTQLLPARRTPVISVQLPVNRAFASHHGSHKERPVEIAGAGKFLCSLSWASCYLRSLTAN